MSNNLRSIPVTLYIHLQRFPFNGHLITGLTCLSVVSSAHVGQDVPVDEVFVAGGRLHEAVGTQRGRKRNLRCFCPKEKKKSNPVKT